MKEKQIIVDYEEYQKLLSHIKTLSKIIDEIKDKNNISFHHWGYEYQKISVECSYHKFQIPRLDFESGDNIDNLNKRLKKLLLEKIEEVNRLTTELIEESCKFYKSNDVYKDSKLQINFFSEIVNKITRLCSGYYK